MSLPICAKCQKEITPSQLTAKFSCNHISCYECIKNTLTLTQVLQYKNASTISIECLANKHNCSENGYYILSITALLEYLTLNSSNNLNYNENENIYSSKLKNKNRDIENTISTLSRQYKETIYNDISNTCNKIDVLILYLNESKNEYRQKMENLFENLNNILKVTKFLLIESEYYNDVNQDCLKLIKENINFSSNIENEIKEQSFSIFDCLTKEIKNIKSPNTVETMINSITNNISNANNLGINSNESIFSCEVEKVNSSNVEGIFFGHTNTIWTLIELNENTIASGSYDNSICIWNMSNHEAIQTLNKHKSKVTKLLHILPLNPNDTSESIFASGSADTTIIIWGCPNNVSSQYAPLTTLYGHSSSVNTMLQFNNDKLISGAHEIIVWDMNKNYNIISILSTYKFPVTSLCNSSLGEGFYSGSYENIYIWTNKMKCVSMIKTSGHYVTCLCYVNDKNIIISGAYDKTIRVWDKNNNNKCLKILREHSNTVWEIFQINKVKLCSGSSNEIIIWDMNCFVSLVVIEEDNYALIRLNNGRFAYGCYDNKIKVLNTEEFL